MSWRRQGRFLERRRVTWQASKRLLVCLAPSQPTAAALLSETLTLPAILVLFSSKLVPYLSIRESTW